MNLNLFRTILTVLAGLIPIITVGLGCTTLPTGGADCSASWIGPQFAVLISGGLLLLNMLVKAFGQGGTVGENLASPSVVVTPEAKVGTVTAAQVQARPLSAAPKI